MALYTDGQGIQATDLESFYKNMAPLVKGQDYMTLDDVTAIIEESSATGQPIWTYDDFKSFILD